PLLAYTLQALYLRVGPGGTVTAEDYRQIVSSMASITRNAVGTEATAPKTSACRRRPSRFAKASPPPAMVTARSEITLPGSWRRCRLHIGASAADRASVTPWGVFGRGGSVNPERSAISASR